VSIRRFPALGDDILSVFKGLKTPQQIHYRNSSTIQTTVSSDVLFWVAICLSFAKSTRAH